MAEYLQTETKTAKTAKTQVRDSQYQLLIVQAPTLHEKKTLLVEWLAPQFSTFANARAKAGVTPDDYEAEMWFQLFKEVDKYGVDMQIANSKKHTGKRLFEQSAYFVTARYNSRAMHLVYQALQEAKEGMMELDAQDETIECLQAPAFQLVQEDTLTDFAKAIEVPVEDVAQLIRFWVSHIKATKQEEAQESAYALIHYGNISQSHEAGFSKYYVTLFRDYLTLGLPALMNGERLPIPQ